MKKQSKKLRKQLINRAAKLTGRGYSVIPLYGDCSAAEPKKPTIKWRAYQKRIPDQRELQTMFDTRAGALAVVCGQVSQLLVIDFDDHLRYQQFCRHLPQYAQTYTVKTRRGYHLYFRTGEKVPSHQFDGGDIKGERAYVVTAPSVVAGFEYRVVQRDEPADLDRGALDAILNYFHIRAQESFAGLRVKQVSSKVDIAAMYGKLQREIGRNNALYRCASVGKRQGMNRDELEKALLQRYVMSEAPLKHAPETFAERFADGCRTIASAFRRSDAFHQASGIPNSVRERLLATQKSSVVARLLDIMFIAGWQADALFYMSEAVSLAAEYGLSRKSVHAALTGNHSTFNGRHIISRRYVEYLDIGGLKSGSRGRPAQLLFQAPSVLRLMEVLEVSWSPSDLVSKSDLSSSHAYRRALHREYVKRVSPRSPMSFLAGRLGVNTRTLRRYNAALGVQVCERVGRFSLTWDSLKCLPRRGRDQLKNHTPGYWLAIGESARFPAWRHIGAALLKRASGEVQVCVRRPSLLTLDKAVAEPLVYEPLSVEMFMRLRVWRGEHVADGGWLDRLRGFAGRVRARTARIRYEKISLRYESVARHIPEDKVAESIQGYLVAESPAGAEVRRPARRGVAYRMLKEFGEGNVLLAVRDSYRDVLRSMAERALRLGEADAGVNLLARSMA